MISSFVEANFESNPIGYFGIWTEQGEGRKNVIRYYFHDTCGEGA